ncbi:MULTISPECIES: hypothetical protein [unclassified Streptomyces]|uniref:hypothetical protein n=1 Tax=unclassified Streptomyces TaxID=2593676 RepID=UPI002E10499C|nr:hypothetical protein OG457_39480 [Streptomyces sp. NBC_01207]WTA22482.1 hypothetical protein OG365_33125 [Streptomyces sp. NBC_00853]
MKWPWRAETNAEAKADESAEAIDGPAFDEESIGQRIQARLDADARAAAAAERAGHERMVERWGSRVVEWRGWLARSPVGVDLLHWWYDEAELTALVGAERYVERLGELLSQASARDVAAMGIGCTRRVDRACRFAETCSQDPVVPPGEKLASYRHGGIPGACSSFMDCSSPHEIDVTFADGDDHRSVVLFRDHPGKARLWVDGVRVGEGEWLDKGGIWVEGRYFTIQIEGPKDHPEQGLGAMGRQLHNIVSLLIHDAERGTTRILVPEATESWTDPALEVRGGTGRVYPTREARAAGGTPDRIVPLDEPEAPAG